MRPQQQAAPAASDRCDKMTERLDRYTDDVTRDGDLALVGILCCGRRVERQLGDAVAMTYLFKPCDYTQNTSEQIFDLVSAIFPLFYRRRARTGHRRVKAADSRLRSAYMYRMAQPPLGGFWRFKRRTKRVHRDLGGLRGQSAPKTGHRTASAH